MTSQPLFRTQYDALPVSIYRTNAELGQAAAAEAAEIIREAVAERGVANAIFATGNSQLTFLEALREQRDVPWGAEAVERALLGPITEDCPASILRRTPHAHLFLDVESAARLKLL
jgi:glucosamine-6-phosphate deaminase